MGMEHTAYTDPTTCTGCGGHARTHNNGRGCHRCGGTGVTTTPNPTTTRTLPAVSAIDAANLTRRADGRPTLGLFGR